MRRDEVLAGELESLESRDALQDGLSLGIALTLVAFVLSPPPAARLPLVLLLAFGLIHPTAGKRSRIFWTIAFVMLALGTAELPRLQLDNHNWLQLYWILAICLAMWSSVPSRTLATASRLLIGFVFVFAVFWKLAVPDFTSGAFFDFTVVTDERFGSVAVMGGLMDPEQVPENRAAIESWTDPTTEPAPFDVSVPVQVQRVSPALAWMTVLIEGAVAVSFLAPLRSRYRWIRDFTLVGFVVLTYPLAPVVAFGRLLLAMGAAQSTLDPPFAFGSMRVLSLE